MLNHTISIIILFSLIQPPFNMINRIQSIQVKTAFPFLPSQLMSLGTELVINFESTNIQVNFLAFNSDLLTLQSYLRNLEVGQDAWPR